MSAPEYDEVRQALLSALKAARSVFFIYEDNLHGVVEPFPWEVEETYQLASASPDAQGRLRFVLHRPTREEWLQEHEAEIQRALALIQELGSLRFELVPFKKRSDVTIRMFEILEDAQAGIFLRLYIPHGRYQSEQFEDFLALFVRYLRDVEANEFTIDVDRTSRGTTYVFKGRDDVAGGDDLRDVIARFDDFLSLTQTDPDAAARALSAAGALTTDASFIVAKYSRSLRRLNLEMRHEFERRRLLLTQNLEADLLDARESELLPLPSADHPSSLFSIVGNTAPVTINLPHASVSTGAQAQIQHIISGFIQYGPEDKAILSLIETLDDKVEALRLRSELDRLKDPETQPEERRTAAQKLKSFLYASGRFIANKASEIGTSVLTTYLESLLRGPK
jgi:hypothetical protein